MDVRTFVFTAIVFNNKKAVSLQPSLNISVTHVEVLAGFGTRTSREMIKLESDFRLVSKFTVTRTCVTAHSTHKRALLTK